MIDHRCQVTKLPPQTERVTLIIFAYHHASDNIASLRYIGWLKYLDLEHYDVHVISRDYHHTGAALLPLSANRRSGMKATAYLLATDLLPISLHKVCVPSDVWLSAAIEKGVSIALEARQADQRCVILASYSPIEALFAASYISSIFELPYWADLRDGLAFETRGRNGFLVGWLRKVLERRALKNSSVISSVSHPICEYYAARFPEKVIELLPNGFDPEIRTAILNSSSLGNDPSTLEHSIGYFGRISLSDSSSFSSLADFMKVYNEISCSKDLKITLEFKGDFTPEELDLIGSEPNNAIVDSPVTRSEAHELMGLSDALLLLTGSRSGTVTGKIFEYLAAGKRIVVFSQTENAAIKMLREIGDDDFIYVRGCMTKEEAASALTACLARPFKRSVDRLHLYDRRQQASKVDLILQRLAGSAST